MPFVADRPFEQLVNPHAVLPAMQRIAADGGNALRDETQRRTPIYTGRQGVERTDDGNYRGLTRRPRPRGTLHRSIQRSKLKTRNTGAGRLVEVTVFSDDPVAPFVEYNTKPHRIRPIPPGQALRFFWKGRVWVMREVHHPGTQGAHMFARAAVWLERELPVIARPGMAQLERELLNSRTGRVIDRTGRGPVRDVLAEAYEGFFDRNLIEL